jgi:ferric-dicitrate binding protein FerR (iron transport regulator)
MDPQVSKNILFAFFAGHATPLQKRLVRDWLAQPQNLEQFYQWLEEWEAEHPQFIPDAEAALQLYRSRMKSRQYVPLLPERPAAQRSLSGWRTGWWIAASVAVVVGAALLLLQDQWLYRHYTTAYGEVKTFWLADGSRVTLNAHSSLRVPRFGFGRRSRNVFLRGEAEFLVKHTPDHQRFLVRTPDSVQVEVLGTEFIVNTRPRGTKVVLTRGKVRLTTLRRADAPPTAMKPGDIVRVDTTGKVSVQSSQPPAVHAAWKEHRFVFDNTSLREVAEQIQERFGVRVVLADTALAGRTITGTYKAEDAGELLETLSDLLMDVRVSTIGEAVEIAPQSP